MVWDTWLYINEIGIWIVVEMRVGHNQKFDVVSKIENIVLNQKIEVKKWL